MKNKMAAGTLCNKYANEDQEFIFCSKGRPFGCLVSPHLPTPTSNLIDYNLVREVGMKMSDLQYTKMSFAGNKLRVLGKVSVTVQTIHNGLASGNFHMKANVVLDLSKCLEIECIAGVKLAKQLDDKESYGLGADDFSTCSSSATSSPTSTPRRTPPPARPPAPAATPPRTASQTPPPRPSSPPGFPVQPQYRDTVPRSSQPRSRPPEIYVSMTTITNDQPHSSVMQPTLA